MTHDYDDMDYEHLSRELQAEWRKRAASYPPVSADVLRRWYEAGHKIAEAAHVALADWSARADRLTAKSSRLASEARELDRARKHAADLANLLDDLAPQRRLDVYERFPRP